MFRNREHAGLQLAEELRDRALVEPLVLAIPRGGVVTGAVLAKELNAELDVILSKKLRAPAFPECAIGAVTAEGFMVLDPSINDKRWDTDGYLAEERRHQLAEIARREQLIRGVYRKAAIAGRSVIVTDDGIATGSSMIAALQAVRAKKPRELIVAVPVVPADRVGEIRRWCDDLVALKCPREFWAVSRFYEDFSQVSDGQVLQLLRQFGDAAEPRGLGDASAPPPRKKAMASNGS